MKTTTIFSALVITTALLSSVATSQAASFGTLEWVNRTGTVFDTETIPVEFRLTLDPNSVPLIIGPRGEGPPISGLEQEDFDSLAAEFPGYTITLAYVTHGFGCGGTFGNCTSPPPYRFNFSPLFPSYDADFQPGTPVILPHGEFIPDPIPAPLGTYFHYRSTIYLNVAGIYPDSVNPEEMLTFFRSFTVAEVACNNGDTSCAFTRTVTPVPLPAAAWLFSAGLVGLATVARRRMRA